MPGLSGKVAVVTGASRGIGKGVAIGLARDGAHVIAAARTLSPADAPKGPDGKALPGSLEETVAEIEAFGGSAEATACDLGRDEEIERLISGAARRRGRIDILVANALPLTAVEGLAWEQPLSAWDELMRIGPRCYYALARAAAPHMIEQRSGLIVTVSAAIGADGTGYSTAFGVVCAAADRIAQGFADELRPHGVAAVALWPNYVRTERVLMAVEGQATGFTLAGGFDPLKDADTPELQGTAIARLAADPELMRHSGKVQVVGDLARRYGFTDAGGRRPEVSPRVVRLRGRRGSIAPLAYD